MTKKVFRLVACVLALTAMASPAFAQALPWEGRAYVNVNFGMQLGSKTDIATSTSVTTYDETGKITGAQAIDAKAPFFEVGAGVRLVGNFGFGIAYTRMSKTGSADVSASIPSPLIYDSFRTATASVADLAHVEQAFHFQAVWMLPITDKFGVTFSAGPTVFKLKQGSVLETKWAEVGSPYTSVTVTPTYGDTTASRIGFNVGADVWYRFVNHLGVGVTARYAGRKFDLKPTGGSAMDVKVGGFQLGAGLRVRF
jgi:hypothetical protein